MKNLIHIPTCYMPVIGTIAYQVLSLLSDSLEHEKEELLMLLRDDPRSPIQALRGKVHGFWSIHNRGSPRAIYQLDERHTQGDRALDMQARLEAEIAFREYSRRLAERETLRLPRAIRAEAIVKSAGQRSFNFSDIKQSSVVKRPEIMT